MARGESGTRRATELPGRDKPGAGLLDQLGRLIEGRSVVVGPEVPQSFIHGWTTIDVTSPIRAAPLTPICAAHENVAFRSVWPVTM